MNTSTIQPQPSLPPAVQELLTSLVESAKTSFADDLKSMLLFGSGAEGRLQATSDLNLMIVLKRFDRARVDAFREPLRVACMAYKASPMFVLESELAQAAEAFAVKFDDISRRRRVLFGEDPMPGISASRAARKQRLCQVLMNLVLRLRERYASISLREEKLGSIIAESASPLHSAAVTLLELEGKPAAGPDEALQLIASGVDGAAEGLKRVVEAKEKRAFPPGVAATVVFQLISLADVMRQRADKLT